MELANYMTEVVTSTILVGNAEDHRTLHEHFATVTKIVRGHEAEGRIAWARTMYHQNPVSPAMLVVTEIESRKAPAYPDYDAGVQYIGEPQKPSVE